MAKLNSALKIKKDKDAQSQASRLIMLKENSFAITQKQELANAKKSLINIADRIKTYGNPLRDISTFNRSFKTTNEGKITLAVAQHIFGKYKTPSFLQNSWFHLKPLIDVEIKEDVTGRRRDQTNRFKTTVVPEAEINLRCKWFVCVASGGSLWKEYTKAKITLGFSGEVKTTPLLTRQENHDFLTCPLDASFREALLYAIARSYTQKLGLIHKIMKCKMLNFAFTDGNPLHVYTETIWREAIHFFCEHENLSLQQINDLIDYFIHAKAQPQTTPYSLKGRHLASLTRQMKDWHWELTRVQKMGDAHWEGVMVADSSFTIKSQPGRTWTFTQMKSSKALSAEGSAMHHCVYSYQSGCISGKFSIWSVKLSSKICFDERVLTIELTEEGKIVQIRGYANRSVRPEEMEAVRHWASIERLSIKANS